MHNTLTLHGANPENLYHAFSLTMPEKIIDFSTNTNIFSWPEIRIDVENLASRYPDIECSRLRELIAEREHIPPSRILFTNGSNEAIFLLAGLFPDDTAILQPAYSEYARAFTNLHNMFTLDDAKNFKQVIIINPNNPTGIYTPLHDVIASSPQTMFIIDEAYRDFLLAREPERLCDFDNVIILRSLTKIYHLSGARIGYVIAPENVIAALRERQPSWSVNAIAQELALHFLKDNAFLERTHAFYSKNTPAFMRMLSDAGCEVMKSDVHYFLVRINDDMRTIEHLLRAGIVVRHTRNFTGLDGRYIRIASRTLEDNQLLITSLKEVL